MRSSRERRGEERRQRRGVSLPRPSDGVHAGISRRGGPIAAVDDILGDSLGSAALAGHGVDVGIDFDRVECQFVLFDLFVVWIGVSALRRAVHRPERRRSGSSGRRRGRTPTRQRREECRRRPCQEEPQPEPEPERHARPTDPPANAGSRPLPPPLSDPSKDRHGLPPARHGLPRPPGPGPRPNARPPVPIALRPDDATSLQRLHPLSHLRRPRPPPRDDASPPLPLVASSNSKIRPRGVRPSRRRARAARQRTEEERIGSRLFGHDVALLFVAGGLCHRPPGE
mmetsp:Transcript_6928/g.14080  ORF Transcript_6928/g.14080 Transcript_6928/m.14080 type:complete len:284 (+) Transcript_6928:571-1422(+)